MNKQTDHRQRMIGIDRLVRITWLDLTSSLVLAEKSVEEIHSTLKTELKPAFKTPDHVVRGSIDKVITILLKIWVTPPTELKALHEQALRILQNVPESHRVAIHWGMVMATYPFWSSVAAQVGRLLRLQGTAAAAQVQRRACELLGDRTTVSRRVRYVLRSYLDWGVLREGDRQGIYTAGKVLDLDDPRLITWLAEAFLHTRTDGSASLKELLNSPSLFPFRLRPVKAESLLAVSSRLDVLRHGLDDELVMLRRNNTISSTG